MSNFSGLLDKTFSKVMDALFKREFGQNGFDYINDTSANSNNWIAIKATGDANAVFTTLTTSTGDDLDSTTLKAGDVIYGPFTNITLTSGAVIAYRQQKQ
jgi:hypothetical protein